VFKHNLTATLNLQRKDKDGNFPLRMRTTIQRKITYYATGINIKEKQWDKKKKEIINHPHKEAMNAMLRKKLSELEKQLINAALKGEVLTKTKKKKAEFITFCEDKIKEQMRSDKPVTTRHKQSDLNILRSFRTKIPMESVSVALLHQFEDYCANVLGNSVNTVWGHLKFVKAMLREAAKEGLLDSKLLLEYKMPKYVDPERDFLILEEVDKIEAFRNETKTDKLRHVADWFLLSCYAGFRYEDIRKFSKDRIRNGKILLRTSKKGKDVTLAIHPRLQAVLDRVPEGVYSNQKCNDYLKIIDANTGINKDLTMHRGRHSFAVIFLELGGTMEELQLILGHSKLATTAIYGRITNKRLDAAIKRTWG
jgi:integrase/recombinase XerD